MSRDDGIIGVSDHGGWAVLVTVTRDGTLLDRRRVELVDEDPPRIPHHSEGQALPLDAAVALVERVRCPRNGTRSSRVPTAYGLIREAACLRANDGHSPANALRIG
jgi:hypothetical protein